MSKFNMDELLQEVLVPKSQQPFEVPDNWIWIFFETLKINNTSFGDGDWILSENFDSNGCFKLIQLADIGEGTFLNKSSKHINENTFIALNCTEIFSGDILISRMGDPIARSCIVPDLNSRLITAVDIAFLRNNVKLSDKKYINYLCNSSYFTLSTEKLARGTTRKRISRKDLSSISIPLPPLSEQIRIVTKLDRLLEKISEARAYIEEVKGVFEKRRLSILENAFKGELTKRWRTRNDNIETAKELLSKIYDNRKRLHQNVNIHEQYGIEFYENKNDVKINLPQKWIVCSIGDIGIVSNGSTPSRKVEEYWGGSIPWISSGEVRNNIIKNANEFITEKGYNGCSVKVLPKGTVLLAMIGEGKTRGQTAVLDIDATINQNIAAINIEHGLVEPKYLWLWLQYQYENTRTRGSGSGPKALNCQRVKEIAFVLAPLVEQKKIVKLVDTLLKKEEDIREINTIVEKSLYTLEKSILSKAFLGELGTNNPDEVSALELLKEVLKERQAEGIVSKKKPQKKKIEISVLDEGHANEHVFIKKISPSILSLLKSSGKTMIPEELWKLSGIKDIREFYKNLKTFIDEGKIVEHRNSKGTLPGFNDCFLEVKE